MAKAIAHVSYSISEKVGNDWQDNYRLLNEADMIVVACSINKMNRKRIAKLVYHTSRKFNTMSSRTCSVTKVFHDEPPKYIDYWDQTRARVDKALKTLKDNEQSQQLETGAGS